MTTLLLHMAATWAMVGFIWTIQVLQYPLMTEVPRDGFPRFEAVHQRRVTAVIALFGPLEVVMAAVVFLTVDTVPSWLSIGSGAVLAAIWPMDSMRRSTVGSSPRTGSGPSRGQ